MNPEQPEQQAAKHRNNELSLESFPAHSQDALVLARWEEGLHKWGHAFVAFARLGFPHLHTEDVLTAFEDSYIGSFPSEADLVDFQIDALGWKDALETFRRQSGVTDELVWDRQAILQEIEAVHVVVHEGPKVHLFDR